MKRILIFFVLFSLVGCGNQAPEVNEAMTFRQKLINSNGCTFCCEITADYKQEVYSFEISCTVLKSGDIRFAVMKPDSIAGITGEITETGGQLTFADRVLAFEPIADGLLSPVIAPWVIIKALKGGYISSTSVDGDISLALIHDSYRDETLEVDVTFRFGIPVKGEITWEGFRYLSVTFESFTFV